jgi:uroporphyrin-III C-methyltransferase
MAGLTLTLTPYKGSILLIGALRDLQELLPAIIGSGLPVTHISQLDDVSKPNYSSAQQFEFIGREAMPSDLVGRSAVFIAGDGRANIELAREAHRCGVPVHVVGQPLLSTFQLPDQAGRRDAGLPAGTIYLVGAGPGNPELLTKAALNALEQADIVFYDKLIASAIMDLIPATAARQFVGKSRGHHSMTQDDIGRALVAAARQGLRVVRLKSGDPFIFGRGGEEMIAARQAGIPVVIVPGITAALGCAAAAGIPLTQRLMAGAVTLATGHRSADGRPTDWAQLVGDDRTLVLYMGKDEAPRLTEDLLNAGIGLDMPIALIENGTRTDMRVEIGTLGRLPDLAKLLSPHAPCLIIIGTVVRLSDHWRELAPLVAAAE